MPSVKLLWKGEGQALCETDPCEHPGANLRTAVHTRAGWPPRQSSGEDPRSPRQLVHALPFSAAGPGQPSCRRLAAPGPGRGRRGRLGVWGHGTLAWVAVPSSRGLSSPGVGPRPPALQVGSILSEPQGSPGGPVKSPPARAGDAGDAGSTPGSGRSSREGKGSPLQYSCLGNPLDRGAWRATVHGFAESDTTERPDNKDAVEYREVEGHGGDYQARTGRVCILPPGSPCSPGAHPACTRLPTPDLLASCSQSSSSEATQAGSGGSWPACRPSTQLWPENLQGSSCSHPEL